ncbi:hypothetical protein [Kribbella deserti]|uniref:Uncharacterized protein n=1 Tax=Kribbella deserti TaxID=1926257 RepID=A0ABV6QI55_9ACTN
MAFAVTACGGDSPSGGPSADPGEITPTPGPPGTPTAGSPGASGTPQPTATVSPDPTQSLPGPGERIALTLRDNGRALVIRRSTRIRLVLPDDFVWTEPKGARLDVQRVLSDAPMGVKEWEIRPTGSGRTTLTTTGKQLSRDPQTGPSVCGPTSPSCRNYTVTLLIS